MSLADLLMTVSKDTKTHRILKHLKKHRKATGRDLSRFCHRFGARLHDLREEGYIIETERLKDGLFSYTYKGHRDDAKEEA